MAWTTSISLAPKEPLTALHARVCSTIMYKGQRNKRESWREIGVGGGGRKEDTHLVVPISHSYISFPRHGFREVAVCPVVRRREGSPTTCV